MSRLVNIGLLALGALVGCGHDTTPAPPPARVPDRGEVRASEDARFAKPLPDQGRPDLPAPPFNDVPLVSQDAPETAQFVKAYNNVGRPRVLVWVMQEAGTGYDEAAARSIDYAAMQTILTDWFASGGAVAVISQTAARQSLGAEQTQSLDSGKVGSGKEINDRIHADILVMVRAQPTRQSAGPAVRLVADVSNLLGGESIARAVVDVPPPLDKPQLNTYTRFLARKLMKDMTGSWTSFGNSDPAASKPH